MRSHLGLGFITRTRSLYSDYCHTCLTHWLIVCRSTRCYSHFFSTEIENRFWPCSKSWPLTYWTQDDKWCLSVSNIYSYLTLPTIGFVGTVNSQISIGPTLSTTMVTKHNSVTISFKYKICIPSIPGRRRQVTFAIAPERRRGKEWESLWCKRPQHWASETILVNDETTMPLE